MAARLLIFHFIWVFWATNAFSAYRFQATREFQVGDETAIGFIVRDDHDWFHWLHPEGEQEQGSFLDLNTLKKQVYKWYTVLSPAKTSMFAELDFQNDFNLLIGRHRKKPILVFKAPSGRNVYTLSKNENSRLLEEIKTNQTEITLLGNDDVVEPVKTVINTPIKIKVQVPESLKEGIFQVNLNSYQELKKEVEEILSNDPRVLRYWVDLPKNLITDAGEKTASFFTWKGVPYSVQVSGKSLLQVVNLQTMQLSKSRGLPFSFANHVNTPIFVHEGTDGVYALFGATNYGASQKTYIACVLQPKLNCEEVLLDKDHLRRFVELNGNNFEVGRYEEPQNLQFKTVFMRGIPFGDYPVGMWTYEDRNPTINSYRRAINFLDPTQVIAYEHLWEMDQIKPFLPFGKSTSYNSFEDPETEARYISMHVNGIRYRIASTTYSISGHILVEVSDDFENYEN